MSKLPFNMSTALKRGIESSRIALLIQKLSSVAPSEFARIAGMDGRGTPDVSPPLLYRRMTPSASGNTLTDASIALWRSSSIGSLSSVSVEFAPALCRKAGKIAVPSKRFSAAANAASFDALECEEKSMSNATVSTPASFSRSTIFACTVRGQGQLLISERLRASISTRLICRVAAISNCCSRNTLAFWSTNAALPENNHTLPIVMARNSRSTQRTAI